MSAEPLGGATLAAGTRLGRYEIVEAVAAGGMGEVYRARDTHLPRAVAIKTLRLGSQGSDDRRRRLQREARIAARLSHPHICRLYDLGREGEVDFLVMEYLEGETLRQRLERGPLEADEAIRLGIQIAGALAEAHRHGVIHRDLKPSNVMLTGVEAMRNVSLLDFGIATQPEASRAAAADTLTEEPLTREGQVIGTTAYMSPEQLLGRELDARTDLFAFGVLLYEMVSGSHPFAASSPAAVMARILDHDPAPLSLPAGAAPGELSRFVEGCLAKDPAHRWQTAERVVMELRRCRGRISAAVGETTPSPGEHSLQGPEESGGAPPHAMAGTDIRTAVARTVLVGAGVAAASAALYLNNPSVHDAVLYELLALLGVAPIALLAAAIAGVHIATAARTIVWGLGSFVGAAPRGAQGGGRRALGLSLFLFAGAVVTLVLGHVADNVMPQLTFLPHARSANTAWALSDPGGDWAFYRTQYKSAFLSHTGGDEADFQGHKYALGRASIRGSRTLWIFAVILAAAGAVDLVRRQHRRGLVALILGIGAGLVLYAFWYAREGHYVKEMVAASLRLPDSLRPDLPESAPDALRRLLERAEP